MHGNTLKQAVSLCISSCWSLLYWALLQCQVYRAVDDIETVLDRSNDFFYFV
jgi:hypothetical protein